MGSRPAAAPIRRVTKTASVYRGGRGYCLPARKHGSQRQRCGRPVRVSAVWPDLGSRSLRRSGSSGTSLNRQPSKAAADGSNWRLPDFIASDSASASLNGVLHPNDPRYKLWYATTVAAAAFTGIFTPWQIAFSSPHELFTLDNPAAWVEAALLALFSADIVASFFVAFQDGDALVHERDEIKGAYVRSGRLAWDVLGVVPFDALLVTLAGGMDALDEQLLLGCCLLRLLHLVRLYRVKWLFAYLEYNLAVSLLWVTILRNGAIVLFLTHWSACAFLDIAKLVHFQQDLIIGADATFFQGLPALQQYLYSTYWAITTLSTVPDFGDSVPATVNETLATTLRTLLFMLFNIALGAYVVGTTTLLVVKSDERTGRYRERSQNLRDYTSAHDLPEDLKESMQEHLRLHFENEEASDEQVLSIYPTTIRRRILRHLYLQYLQSSYLFAGCGQKFLDALLTSARLEVYMPKVDILAAGEVVNEVCLVVAGAVEVLPPDGRGEEEDVRLDPATLATVDVAPLRVCGPGELFGEAAFFTETPQLEAIRSLTVTRVLTISRAAFEYTEHAFPLAARLILENLRLKAEQAVKNEFGRLDPLVYERITQELNTARLRYSWASAELIDVADRGAGSLTAAADVVDSDGNLTVTARQEQVLANLVRVQALVADHISKLDEEATTRFLYAASRGSTTKVRQMLNQGFEVDRPDYDGRTALMLACVKGHSNVVRMLLDAGADPSRRDALGSSALLEACKYGHDDIIRMLREQGARLGQGTVEDASLLCTCVYECNLPLLRRLLRSGVPVNAYDYDKRTALHISAAEGNLASVRLLVEEGRATLDCLDRWGHTPLDEAERIGASNVVQYLISKISQDEEYYAAASAKRADDGWREQGGRLAGYSYRSNIDSEDEEPFFEVPRGFAGANGGVEACGDLGSDATRGAPQGQANGAGLAGGEEECPAYKFGRSSSMDD